MIISIASGKGGTGKTTISTNLARSLLEKVVLLDCDVEEPNANLFINGTKKSEEIVSMLMPVIDMDKCDGCGKCSDFCEFNALAIIKEKTIFFPELCHGCGGCKRICPKKAIKEEEKRIGTLTEFETDNINFIEGRLDIGISIAPLIIKAVKEKAISYNCPNIIIDAPPGTSCPAVATVKNSDFVILVTEPTPFGLNDLILAIAMIRELDLPFGVVINKSDNGDDRVVNYCKSENINILMEIPDDIRIAQAYSKGIMLIDAFPEYKEKFINLYYKVKELVNA